VFLTLPALGTDNTASSWAREGITEAITKGFVPPDIQDDYTAVITREEFCRMAVRWVEFAMDKSIDEVLSGQGLSRSSIFFTDTNDPDILAAFALGITSGTGNGLFSPKNQFSREQAATMIMNTARAIGADTENVPVSDFTDLATAAAWAYQGINFVRAHSIMAGTGNYNFSPKALYTREQSIVTFNNIKPENLPKAWKSASEPVPPSGGIGDPLPPSLPYASAFEREVFDLVNIARINYGLNALEWHDGLAALAKAHSVDMVQRGYFSHICPDGTRAGNRVINSGIKFTEAFENLARGYRTPQAAVTAWMNSPAHRATILDEKITHLGVGFHEYLWTQKFIAQPSDLQ